MLYKYSCDISFNRAAVVKFYDIFYIEQLFIITLGVFINEKVIQNLGLNDI